ncbi:MAG TPA: hypothetical protein VG326_17475 [Tepidisphaeraceae bacterium]|nr:hypothetical protein [Tepidisphaeraceae bacterium]
MASPKHQLHLFLRAVHRRLALVRLFEHVGLTILFASALASIATVILLWHDRPARSIDAIIAAIAIVAGGVWGIASRPTVFQAALEIDRQTDSAELFSSAWLACRADFSGDPWAGAVVASASDRCRADAIAAVNLRRYGARMWGGVALAVALVVTLVMLGPAPVHPPQADAAAIHASKSAKDGLSADGRQAIWLASADNRPIILADPDDLSANSSGPSQTTADKQSPGKTGDVEKLEAHASSAASSDGQGGKSARTNAPSASSRSRLAEHASGSHTSGPDHVAATANGVGLSSPSQSAVGGSAGAATLSAGNATQLLRAPPPWKGAEWPIRMERARQALDGGHVPAGYRDLIRDYFSPESISAVLPD